MTGDDSRPVANGLGAFAWAVEASLVLIIVLAVMVALAAEPLAWLSAAFEAALLALWGMATADLRSATARTSTLIH